MSESPMYLRYAMTFIIAVLIFLFGIFSLIGLLIVQGVWLVLTPFHHNKEVERIYENCLSICMRGGSYGAMLFNPFWKLRVLKEAPKGYSPGRTIVMCNHLSGGDPFMLNRVLFPWPLKYVYKDSLRSVPILGQCLCLCGDIPIYFTADKGGWGTKPGSIKTMFERCKYLLQMNIGIVIFPEGTRSYTKQLQPFKDGFFKFAIENDVEIFPMIVHNTGSIFPQDSIAETGTAYVAFGEPIPAKMFTSLVTGKKEEDITIEDKVEALKAAVQKQMLALLPMSPLFDPKVEKVSLETQVHRGTVKW